MNNKENYMRRAIELANLGWGRTNPNPLVGAVIVKDGRIIGEGFHEVLGCAHAEVAALNNATEDVFGSTLYVNLEPCSHYGRTPPCAKAIIEAGIKKVFISMVDPNPKVSGKGITMLKNEGVEVEVGILEDEARKLNEIFINYIEKKSPFVILKSAMTLDGKIASCMGDSKWITGEKAREYVHVIRDRVAGIMVGINTVLKDDPTLTTRLADKKGNNPVRIIVDSKGCVPLQSNVFKTINESKVIIATTSELSKSKEESLIESGAIIIKADGNDGKVDLNYLMNKLYQMEIDSVLLEGGGTLNSSAIKAGIVNKVMFFVAPKIIGGINAPTPVEGEGIYKMSNAYKVCDMSVQTFGEDVLLEGYVK